MKAALSILLLTAICACASDAPSDTLSCPQSIDSFCATSPTKCARTIVPSDVIASVCAGTSPGTWFGIAGCPSGWIYVLVDDQFWEYDPTKHELNAVYSQGVCIAGPSSLPKRTEQCFSNLLAYGCVSTSDGGTDASSD
ncbi:hypothetical protein BH09MYX1_BH09MYX1_29770 [soil metagenome]